MYKKLDELDAQSLALQAMLGMIRSQHIVRQAINADPADNDASLLVLADLVARATKTLDYKQKPLSPFGSAFMRTLVKHAPTFIRSLKSQADMIGSGNSNREVAQMQNIRNAMSTLRMSVEQARSVINYVEGTPLDLESAQIEVLYTISHEAQQHGHEEMLMR